MTDREKLVELIDNAADLCPNEIEVITVHLLANGVTFAKDKDVPSKWISVGDEEKPRHGQECIIRYTFDNRNYPNQHFYGVASYCAGGDNGYVNRPHFENEGWYGMRVTHWMEIPELPEPPKEGC